MRSVSFVSKPDAVNQLLYESWNPVRAWTLYGECCVSVALTVETTNSLLDATLGTLNEMSCCSKKYGTITWLRNFCTIHILTVLGKIWSCKLW